MVKSACFRFGFAALLVGCGGSIECDTTLAVGATSLEVDGDVWNPGPATWMWSGSSLQVTVEKGGGYFMSVVAQKGPDGESIADVVDAGGLPIEIDLSGDGGGWAVLYPDQGSSFTSRDGGGVLRVESIEGDELLGCVEFEGVSSDGAADVEGSFSALGGS